jgi:hypothetical protein
VRIRDAPLEGFAHDGAAATSIRDAGAAATSIRDAAAAAGVSPGLVQHHFGWPGAGRAAAHVHVTEVARAALAVRPVEGDVVEDIAERLTALVAEHFIELRYLGRGVAEEDEAAMAIFDTLVGLCRDQLAKFEAEGLLRRTSTLSGPPFTPF